MAFLFSSDKGVEEDFAQDVPDAERKLLIATQVPTQGSVLGASMTAAAWHTKPSWFVIAANDRMIAPEQERATAKRMNSRTLTLPTSHVPMLSRPADVAGFLNEAALGKNTPTPPEN